MYFIDHSIHFLCHIINSQLKVYVGITICKPESMVIFSKNIFKCFIRSQKFNIAYNGNFNLQSSLEYWNTVFYLTSVQTRFSYFMYVYIRHRWRKEYVKEKEKNKGERMVWSLKIFDTIQNAWEFDSVGTGKPLKGFK